MSYRNHDGWAEFLQKAVRLPTGYSLDDLKWFEQVAKRQYPMLAPLVTACIELARSSGNLGPSRSVEQKSEHVKNVADDSVQDVYEILRDISIFPKNSDVIELIQRMLPDMPAARLDKMSREEVIKRIDRQLDKEGLKRRYQFASVLRAIQSQPNSTGSRPLSFLARWEAVIRETKR